MLIIFPFSVGGGSVHEVLKVGNRTMLDMDSSPEGIFLTTNVGRIELLQGTLIPYEFVSYQTFAEL